LGVHELIGVGGILICGFHLGAALGAAELGDGAVEEVDLVVEVDT
jgi:hypothetical protein